MGCWQLLHMKQCSCQVCPLYSSLRDPAERAVHSNRRAQHTHARGTGEAVQDKLQSCTPGSPWQRSTAGSWRGDAPGPPHSRTGRLREHAPSTARRLRQRCLL